MKIRSKAVTVRQGASACPLLRESVLYPDGAGGFQADDVEAACRRRAAKVSGSKPGQEELCGTNETALLLSVYTGGGTPVFQGAACAHFHKHEYVAVDGDQVDFAGTALQILRDDHQAAVFQVGLCLVLALPAAFLGWRQLRFVVRAASGHRTLPAPPVPDGLLLGFVCQRIQQCFVIHYAPVLIYKARFDSMDETSDFSDSPVAWKRLIERVGGQSWPAATLYVVATPIGNLGDLSMRAWQTLTRCDVIAAEDTRASRVLLDAWGVDTPLMAAHRHNEAGAAEAIVQKLASGARVALVSDAGAPAVSDPGARIVRAVRDAGYGVVAIPGASAVITALMASGATSDENPAFAFAGFPPAKATARQKWLQRWCALPCPIVMFESPHRLAASIRDLLQVCGPDRTLTIGRELTKRFEQVHTLSLAEASGWLDQDAHRSQGEFVLIVHEAVAAAATEDVDASALSLLDALLESVSVRDAARVAAKVTGLPRDTLYAIALGRQKGKGAEQA